MKVVHFSTTREKLANVRLFVKTPTAKFFRWIFFLSSNAGRACKWLIYVLKYFQRPLVRWLRSQMKFFIRALCSKLKMSLKMITLTPPHVFCTTTHIEEEKIRWEEEKYQPLDGVKRWKKTLILWVKTVVVLSSFHFRASRKCQLNTVIT